MVSPCFDHKSTLFLLSEASNASVGTINHNHVHSYDTLVGSSRPGVEPAFELSECYSDPADGLDALWEPPFDWNTLDFGVQDTTASHGTILEVDSGPPWWNSLDAAEDWLGGSLQGSHHGYVAAEQPETGYTGQPCTEVSGETLVSCRFKCLTSS